jgi:hypothetical protein
MGERFAYGHAKWCQDQTVAKRWTEELERTGIENVRAILAQSSAGSGARIPIGQMPIVTKGFVQRDNGDGR